MIILGKSTFESQNVLMWCFSNQITWCAFAKHWWSVSDTRQNAMALKESVCFLSYRNVLDWFPAVGSLWSGSSGWENLYSRGAGAFGQCRWEWLSKLAPAAPWHPPARAVSSQTWPGQSGSWNPLLPLVPGCCSLQLLLCFISSPMKPQTLVSHLERLNCFHINTSRACEIKLSGKCSEQTKQGICWINKGGGGQGVVWIALDTTRLVSSFFIIIGFPSFSDLLN